MLLKQNLDTSFEQQINGSSNNISYNTTTTTPNSKGGLNNNNGSNITAIGWFYDTEYEIMRKIIKKILYRRIDEFISRQQQITIASKQLEESHIEIIKPKHIVYEG